MTDPQNDRGRLAAGRRGALFLTGRGFAASFRRGAGRACLALGLALVLLAGGPAAAQTCTASQYGLGDGYHGRRAADGSRFNTYALTAAMRSPVPFGSIKTVTNLANGKTVTVRITDRGPFVAGRCIDLSHAAARAIGMGGLARVGVR